MSPLLIDIAARLLAVGLLVLLVLALRRPVARFFGARAAYALWLLPAVRLIMPDLPALPVLVPGLAPQTLRAETMGVVMHAGSINAHGETAAVADAGSGAGETARLLTGGPVGDIDIGTILTQLAILGALGWLAGVVGLLAARIVAEMRGRRVWRARTHDAAPALRALASDVARATGVRGAVALRQADHACGPLVTGLVRPLIVLPADFETRFSAAQQHFALTHEYLHVARGDLRMAALAELIRVLLWPLPWAKAGLRAFRADQEAACDASVIAITRADPAAYGETLLKAARPYPTALPALTLDHALKERIITMRPRNRLKGGAVAVTLIGLAGLGISGSYAEADDKAKARAEEIARIDAQLAAETARLEARRAQLAAARAGDDAALEGLRAQAPQIERRVVIGGPMPRPPMPPLPPGVAPKPGAPNVLIFGGDGNSVRLSGEDGMVLLSDPMDGLQGRLDALDALDFDIPEFPEIGEPTVTVVELRTKDGQVLKVDDLEVVLPERLAEIEAQAGRIEQRVKEMKIEQRVEAALGKDFEARVEANAAAIKALQQDCLVHQSRSKATTILRRDVAGAGAQKLLCFSGGREALRSTAIQKFVADARGLTDDERERFEDAREGVSYSFQFSTAASEAPPAR